MSFPIKVLNRLRDGMLTAAEIQASHPSRRAWIGITPLPYEPHREFRQYIENRSFQVLRFEVDRDGIDPNYWLPDAAIHDLETIELSNEAQLEAYVLRFVPNLEDLTAPWNCEMPS